MPAQQAVAARTEATIAPSEANRVSDIQLVEVPAHWPPAAIPQPGGGPGAAGERLADPAGDGQAGPRQFAVLLTEALAGVRPVRQLRPWLSERGSVHLHRLLPLFADGHRPRITRVLTTRPARDVIEMTLIVTVGPRTRALAVRLERICPARPAGGETLPPEAARHRSLTSARWLCTDIEAA